MGRPGSPELMGRQSLCPDKFIFLEQLFLESLMSQSLCLFWSGQSGTSAYVHLESSECLSASVSGIDNMSRP